MYELCSLPRVETSSGIKTIEVPWASRSSRVTYAFECIVVEVLKETKNQTKTAELLNCSFNQIHRIMHRCVARGMARRTLADILHVSIDEKALKQGDVYATVVCDSTRGMSTFHQIRRLFFIFNHQKTPLYLSTNSFWILQIPFELLL